VILRRFLHTEPPPRLGLGANWRQFTLLVLVNAFVGAMVGLERTVLPLLAQREFGIASVSATLSFIVTFGMVKAATNLLAGRLGDRWGRKRVLVLGWLVGVPLPLLIIWAPSWSWIVAANVLLGLNQGLTWSTTVIMKIDLVGPARRGLAMGLNEFAGYLAVAGAALGSGLLAEAYGLRPVPFYLGLGVVSLGLALSVLGVRDTTAHAALEEAGPPLSRSDRAPTTAPSLRTVVAMATWRDPALATASQVGLVNNLNDGLAWGAFPLFFAAGGLALGQIALLAFAYPATWGLVQLVTGALSDRWGRRQLIVWGMLLQGAALFAIALTRGLGPWLAASIGLGVGTAMVYPTLLAVVGDVARPAWRGTAVGVYRCWRDLGYAVGAVTAGVLADRLGMSAAIAAVAALTIAAGLAALVRLPETRPTEKGDSRPATTENWARVT
jgi:MFS family permease